MKKSTPPKRYEKVKKEYKDVFQAYERFSDALANTGPLSESERALVRLGVAVGAGLETAVKAHVRRGVDAGLSREELRHAIILSATTRGFPSMMAALSWADPVFDGEDK